MKAVSWCCVGFQTNFRTTFEAREVDGLFTDRRGFFIDCVRGEYGVVFVLIHHAAAKENWGKVAIDAPVTLEQELRLIFCPFCGAKLARRYGSKLLNQ